MISSQSLCFSFSSVRSFESTSLIGQGRRKKHQQEKMFEQLHCKVVTHNVANYFWCLLGQIHETASLSKRQKPSVWQLKRSRPSIWGKEEEETRNWGSKSKSSDLKPQDVASTRGVDAKSTSSSTNNSTQTAILQKLQALPTKKYGTLESRHSYITRREASAISADMADSSGTSEPLVLDDRVSSSADAFGEE